LLLLQVISYYGKFIIYERLCVCMQIKISPHYYYNYAKTMKIILVVLWVLLIQPWNELIMGFWSTELINKTNDKLLILWQLCGHIYFRNTIHWWYLVKFILTVSNVYLYLHSELHKNQVSYCIAIINNVPWLTASINYDKLHKVINTSSSRSKYSYRPIYPTVYILT